MDEQITLSTSVACNIEACLLKECDARLAGNKMGMMSNTRNGGSAMSVNKVAGRAHVGTVGEIVRR